MGKVVEIDCEKSMKLETSRNVTKSNGVAVSVKNICARFITVSVKKLLHYRAGGLLQIGRFYYIIGQLLQYRAFLLHYRAVITVSGVYYIIGWYTSVFSTLIVSQCLVNSPFHSSCSSCLPFATRARSSALEEFLHGILHHRLPADEVQYCYE